MTQWLGFGEVLPFSSDYEDFERRFKPLQWLVENLKYKDGWHFSLHGSKQLSGDLHQALVISVDVEESTTGEQISVHHRISVPDLSRHYDRWDEKRWRRWLLDRIIDVEKHEACEFFTLPGEKPFFPAHGPDGNPYVIREDKPKLI